MSNVLVVGGSSGIGLETVRYFIEKGHSVYVADRNAITDPIGGSIKEFLQCDLLESNRFDQVLSGLPQDIAIDHLVITAGGASRSEIQLIKDSRSFWELEQQSLLETINLNLINQILFIKAFIRLFSGDTSNKSITLTSSINSNGRYGLVAYSTAKAGLEGFVRAAAEDLGKISVRINCVVPGSTRTPLTINEGMDFESVKRQTLLNRVNMPEDLAQTIYLLATSNAVTGQCLICDSGQSLASTRRY